MKVRPNISKTQLLKKYNKLKHESGKLYQMLEELRDRLDHANYLLLKYSVNEPVEDDPVVDLRTLAELHESVRDGFRGKSFGQVKKSWMCYAMENLLTEQELISVLAHIEEELEETESKEFLEDRKTWVFQQTQDRHKFMERIQKEAEPEEEPE